MAKPVIVALLALTAAKDDPLAGRIAGPPQQCVGLDRLDSPDIQPDGRIIYRFTGKTWWVVRPIGPCPALKPLTTLVTEVYGGQLCRNDRFSVITPPLRIPSAPCRFDNFVPYRKP